MVHAVPHKPVLRKVRLSITFFYKSPHQQAETGKQVDTEEQDKSIADTNQGQEEKNRYESPQSRTCKICTV
jgi:hypothetical protein